MEQDKKNDKYSKYDDMIILREWLEKQPHLPHGVDEELLAAFVHGTKSLEIAKKRMDRYFSVRGRAPKLFLNLYSDILDADCRDACLSKFFYLPKESPEGYSSMCMKFSMGDLNKYSYTLALRRIVMLMELGMHLNPEAKGMNIVIDMKDIPNALLAKMNPAITASYFSYFQDAYPIKMKKIIMFNAPTFVNVIINAFIKPFLKPKLFERVSFTDKDFPTLAKYFDVETLPSDYGGKEESINVLDDKWNQLLVDHVDWFKKNSELISDETKRPPDTEDTYGVQGTFRTLAID